MTKKEMVEKFLRSRGYKIVQGDAEHLATLEAFLPWLMMDLQNSLFTEFIAPLPLKNQLKKARKDWAEAYNRFNAKFFNGFTTDEQVEICDYMDDLEKYMKTDLVRLRCAVMEQIPTDDFNAKQVVSASFACLVLTIIAETVHTKVYQAVRPLTKFQKSTKYHQELRPEPVPELRMIQSKVTYFGSNFAHSAGLGNILMSEKIQSLMESLGPKAVRWLSSNLAA